MERGPKEILRLSRVHAPVTALGPGRRVGIWTQGCGIHCPDCISRHTWNPAGGLDAVVPELRDAVLRLLAIHDCRGVTISGGEPFEQSGALGALLEALAGAGVSDILIYSGYAWDFIRHRYPDALPHLAAIVDGPYAAGLPTNFAWKGSSNQRMRILSSDPALRKQYAQFRRDCGPRSLQVIPEKDGIFLIGIPEQHHRELLVNGYTCQSLPQL